MTTYTVKRNTKVLYHGHNLSHAKWRFQLSSQMNQNATITLRSVDTRNGLNSKQLLMMHSRRGLVLNELS